MVIARKNLANSGHRSVWNLASAHRNNSIPRNNYVHRPRARLARIEYGAVAELLCMEHRRLLHPASSRVFPSGGMKYPEILSRCRAVTDEIQPKDALCPNTAAPFNEDEARRQIRREARQNKAFDGETETKIVAIIARQEWEQVLRPLTPRRAPIAYVHPDAP